MSEWHSKMVINASCISGQPSLWTLRMLDCNFGDILFKITEAYIVFTIPILLLCVTYNICSTKVKLNQDFRRNSFWSDLKIPELQCINGSWLQKPDDSQKLKTHIGPVGLTDRKISFCIFIAHILLLQINLQALWVFGDNKKYLGIPPALHLHPLLFPSQAVVSLASFPSLQLWGWGRQG